jgi:histone-lysine N-methyltransferase SETMAR
VAEHPLYSPDLAPSDCHLFGALKDALRGHRFATDQHMQEVAHSWLRNASKTFFSEGINTLVACWNKCIGKQGDYIEK